jgi:hypothetical protein
LLQNQVKHFGKTLTLFTGKTESPLLCGVWIFSSRRKNKRFYHKLLIKDNDDDLFHYAERMKNNLGSIWLSPFFVFPKRGREGRKRLTKNFWDLFAVV